jgi:hypothetical protein
MCDPKSSHYTWLTLAGLALLSGLFWADCLFGPYTPLAAEFQAQMEPWASEASLPAVTRQWDPLLWDGVAQFYPWRLFAARMMRDGQPALWNPHQFCGYPFVSNGQSALFYPPNWLLAVVNIKLGLGLLAAMHYFLAAALTFLLCRQLRAKHLPAAFAAIAFAFGGFMVTWTELPTLMNSAAWLPGGLLGVALVFSRNRWGAPVLALSLSMSVLAGHFQIAAYVWLATGVYALARIAWEAANHRPARIGPLAGGVAIGLAIASAQLLPSLELARNSTRGNEKPSVETFEQFHAPRALQVGQLITLLRPDALGSPARGDHLLTQVGLPYSEYCGFTGIATLVLALVGIGLSRTRHFAFFIVLAVAALNVAMGGPLARLMYLHVPGLAQTGGSARFLSVYTFAIAMAGGLGLNAVCEWLRRHDEICLGDLADEDAAALGDDDEGDEHERGDCPWNMSAATGLCVVALLVLVFELLPWGHEFLPRTRRENVYPVTETTSRLGAGTSRVLAVTPRGTWGFAKTPPAVLPPNSATVYGYDSVGGYDSLFPRSYRQFVNAVEGAEPAPLANGNMLLASWQRNWRLAGVSSIVVSGGDISLGDEATCPRAFVVHDADHWRGNAGAVVARAGESLDEIIADAHQGGAVKRYSRPGPMTIEVQVNSDSAPGLLVVTETLYPGWRVYVDGARRTLEPVGGAFCGLALQPGDSEVRLAFVPATVQVGLFVALLGMAGLLALVAADCSRKRLLACRTESDG